MSFGGESFRTIRFPEVSFMSILRSNFGTAGGKPVGLYSLVNGNGVTAKLTNYGATLIELHVPDRYGRLADVTLGFDTLDGYLRGCPYFGATVGRYANRIAGGQFRLDGKTYNLARNDGENHLHGGRVGFDKVVWEVEPATTKNGPALAMRYVSPDGEEGYPGTLTTRVRFSLTEQDEFRIEISATTDRPTIVNIVNHSYWNLAGRADTTILDHELTINADRYTPTDSRLIPIGDIAPVAGTPYDFRTWKPIGKDLEPVAAALGGYDVNYVLSGDIDPKGAPRLAAQVRHPGSGRIMEIHTTEPGVQFYDGNQLDGSIRGKGGIVYEKHAGFCLETQRFPDSPNQVRFPSPVLRPGQTYRHTLVYRFYVLDRSAGSKRFTSGLPARQDC